MPSNAPKPCSVCARLVRDGSSRCDEHKVRAGTFGDRARGSRQERGYGAEWERTRERILRRDAGICQPCLKLGHVHSGNEVDHIVPRSQGGTEGDDNLQTICRDAHRAKTAQEARGGVQAPAHQPPADNVATARLMAARATLAAVTARTQAPPGGRQKSGAPGSRTAWVVGFLRAQVLGEGGVATGAEGVEHG